MSKYVASFVLLLSFYTIFPSDGYTADLTRTFEGLLESGASQEYIEATLAKVFAGQILGAAWEDVEAAVTPEQKRVANKNFKEARKESERAIQRFMEAHEAEELRRRTD